jgi:dGTPase
MGHQAFPVELAPGKPRNSFRSIECQIMDWADDTAYSLNDIADGIHAGFISVTKLEAWAERNSVGRDEAEHVKFLCEAIRDKSIERRLNRSIGHYISAATLAPDTNFLSAMSRRHRFKLEINPLVRAQSKLNKKIALDLVFRSPQLQQLDYKANFILTRLFEVLRDRYIERAPGSGSLHLMPEAIEAEIARAEEVRVRARLVCDWVASMTDRFAFRTYRRLFDADFGSITDFV